jgi:hypothetical protein
MNLSLCGIHEKAVFEDLKKKTERRDDWYEGPSIES